MEAEYAARVHFCLQNRDPQVEGDSPPLQGGVVGHVAQLPVELKSVRSAAICGGLRRHYATTPSAPSKVGEHFIDAQPPRLAKAGTPLLRSPVSMPSEVTSFTSYFTATMAISTRLSGDISCAPTVTLAGKLLLMTSV